MLPDMMLSAGESAVPTSAPSRAAADADAQGDAVVVARDASYAPQGYRSFEFASLSACRGEVLAAVSRGQASGRDLLLAVAGLVRPTAGSLAVAGVELAAPVSNRRFRLRTSERLQRGTVGIGVVTGLLDVDERQTVEEAVRREAGLRGGAADEDAVLDLLAELGLATHVDQRLCQLEPAARLRLTLALACAGGVQVAVCDLDDPFVGGASADEARSAIGAVREFALRHGTCVIVATHEPVLALDVRAVALDSEAAEALDALKAASGERRPDMEGGDAR